MGPAVVKESGFVIFMKRLAIFLLILIIADFLVGYTLRHFYFSQNSGLEAGTIYAVDKAKEDIIILGSSRASHHYIPGVLSENLHETAYNAGREGNFILYHNAVFQCMVQRYKPKIVILDILNREFDVSGDGYDRLSNLMPFYRNHEAVRPTINLRGPFEGVKNMSFIYPFNSKLQAIAVGNLAFNKKRKQDYNGYIPLSRVMTRAPEDVKVQADYAVDSLKIAAYSTIIETCKNNNIRLVVVCSPYYDRLDGEDRSISIAREIAEKYGVPFWNFSGDTVFAGKANLFDDKAHLNDTGARIYSKLIASKLASE